MNRNLYTYWSGRTPMLIELLRELMIKYSTHGKGYTFHVITPDNLNDYIDPVPWWFDNLCAAHQSDIVRITVLCERGGLYLDADTIVMGSLDCVFDTIDKHDGFITMERTLPFDREVFANGMLGTHANNVIFKKWRDRQHEYLNANGGRMLPGEMDIHWNDIGGKMIQSMYNQNRTPFEGWCIHKGWNNVSPVRWFEAVDLFFKAPYEHYAYIKREYQPMIALFNTVYKYVEHMTREELLAKKFPLCYFLNKSLNG